MSDTKSAIHIAAYPIFHKHTKHIEIDYHFIHDKIKSDMLHTVYVPTQHQVADLLTKGLGRVQHLYLLSKLGAILRGSIHEM